VLLKNDDDFLPLKKGKRIAVIGPHADAQAALVGNYLGQLCPDDTMNCIVTPYQTIAQMNEGGTTDIARGCDVEKNDTSGFAAAVSLARNSDYVIMMLGIDGSVEGEDHDRVSIDLPYIQHQLVAAIHDVNHNIVIVLLNGGMVDISQEIPAAKSILEAGYPGFVGASAIAMTLFGENSHLGGKLPYTIYPSEYTTQIKMTEMEMDVWPGRSYRYYTGPVVYPFGYGISLTSFRLENMSCPSHYTFQTEKVDSKSLVYSVKVVNTGDRTGDEVVFAYMIPKNLRRQPTKLVKRLFSYERVHLESGHSQIVTFLISSSTFRIVEHSTGNIISTPGDFEIDITNGVDHHILSHVTVVGDELLVEAFP